MSFLNSASICSRVQTVSSTVSCNSPATMADTSSFKVARTSATASGCFRYGSPDPQRADLVHAVTPRSDENLDLVVTNGPAALRSLQRDIAGFVLRHQDHGVGAEDVVRGHSLAPFNHPAAVDLELAIVLLQGKDDEDLGHVCVKRLGRLDGYDLETAGLPHDHLLAMSHHDRGEHAFRGTIFEAAVAERSLRSVARLGEGRTRQDEQRGEERGRGLHSPPFCT